MRWAIAVGLVCGLTVVAALECSDKCPASCSDTDDCSDTVLDPCGCCPVCVREAGERCGHEEGVCGAHLICASDGDPNAEDESGVCQEMNAECAKAKCDVLFHPECPGDSRLTFTPPAPGECCAQPSTCQCDLEKCDYPLECDTGFVRVLVSRGNQQAPGHCCDVFECRRPESHCVNVKCPSVNLGTDPADEGECPEDSVREASHVPDGTCCPVAARCRCKASVCKPAKCPEGKSASIVKKGTGRPGQCCDEWKCEEEPNLGCMRDGAKYADGQEWQSGSCESCRCKRGVAVCSKMQCPKPPPECTWVVIPEGECCPVCVGCQTENLEKKRKNETWQRDDCTTCTCSENGAPTCLKHMCRTECDSPRKVEGQCCPVCDEPTLLTLPATCPSLEHCSLRCENGLRRDDQGCFLCDCLPDTFPNKVEDNGVGCPTLEEQKCDKQCAHGYARDNRGCAVCKCAKCPPLHQCLKHCLYGFEANALGCPVCKCRAGGKAAKPVEPKGGKETLDKCFGLSPSGALVERDSGEWWNDGCRHCFCEQNHEFCSLISCPDRPESCPEEDWVHREGACCASCSSSSKSSVSAVVVKEKSEAHEHTVCQSPGSGRLFTDGETWQLAPCVACTCRVGHVLCRVVACPPIACKNPIHDEENPCCAKCPSNETVSTSVEKSKKVVCSGEKDVHMEGETWRADDCTSCSCDPDGHTRCYRETCGDLKGCQGRPLVIKGRCCPVCSDALSSSEAVCTYAESVYRVHEEWRDGACRNCSCVAGGQTLCRETLCPPCSNPVAIQGQCCPLCKDQVWAPYDSGTPGVTYEHPNATNLMPFVLFSFVVLLILAVCVGFYFYQEHNKKKRNKANDAPVMITGSRPCGSAQRLNANWQPVTCVTERDAEGRRRNSSGDGQSESLLSTVSDSSSSETSQSSGQGPHQADTVPLTAKEKSTSPV